MGTWAILEVVLEKAPVASICAYGELEYFRVGFRKYAISARGDLSITSPSGSDHQQALLDDPDRG